MADYSLYIDKKLQEDTLAAINKTYLVDAEMTVDVYDAAAVIPGGGIVQSCGGVILEKTFISANTEFKYEDATTFDDEVVYVGVWAAVWGHCITDNLAHLWFLFDEKYHYLNGKKWVYSLVYGNDIPDTFRSLLKIFGVDLNNLYRIDNVTRFKKVYFPSACYLHCSDFHYYSKEFPRFFNVENLPTPKLDLPRYEKIFFSRAQWKNKKEIGEHHLVDAFLKMGYTILYPEKMSLEEQVYAIRHCKCLAVTEGSVAHNAVFMEPGSELVVIRKAYYINNYQYPINEMRGLRVYLIDSHKSVCVNRIEPRHGPFFLYCSKNLKEFAKGLDLGKFPTWEFISYIMNNSAKCMRVVLRKYWYRLLSDHSKWMKVWKKLRQF